MSHKPGNDTELVTGTLSGERVSSQQVSGNPVDGAKGARPLWRRPSTLFFATLLTVFGAGILQSPQGNRTLGAANLLGFDTGDMLLAPWQQPGVLLDALLFAAALLGILVAHEMGHYFSARREGVEVSPPFFIPFLPPLGTLGAVIRIRFERTTPDALMRIAANGPFAGMVVAVPVLIAGLMLSEIQPLPLDRSGLVFMGNGLLIQTLQDWICGVPGSGSDVVFHPLAFAGWAGCLVTAINLLPIGQLDGGHITYVLGPKRALLVSRVALLLLVIGGFFYVGWWLFAFIAGRLIGAEHPDNLGGAELSASGKTRAAIAVLIFAITLPPVPISDSGVWSLIGEFEMLARYLGV